MLLVDAGECCPGVHHERPDGHDLVTTEPELGNNAVGDPVLDLETAGHPEPVGAEAFLVVE